MPLAKSGDVLKMAPGPLTLTNMKSLYMIHSDLKWAYGFGAVEVKYKAQEGVLLGGDLRLSPDGKGSGSWTLPYCTQRALAAILDHINWNGLDAIVSIRNWNKFQFEWQTGVLQFVPPDDIPSNPCEIFPVTFDYIALRGFTPA